MAEGVPEDQYDYAVEDDAADGVDIEGARAREEEERIPVREEVLDKTAFAVYVKGLTSAQYKDTSTVIAETLNEVKRHVDEVPHWARAYALRPGKGSHFNGLVVLDTSTPPTEAEEAGLANMRVISMSAERAVGRAWLEHTTILPPIVEEVCKIRPETEVSYTNDGESLAPDGEGHGVLMFDATAQTLISAYKAFKNTPDGALTKLTRVAGKKVAGTHDLSDDVFFVLPAAGQTRRASPVDRHVLRCLAGYPRRRPRARAA